ncbi:gamma-glutamyltransferase family protein [Actinacidiphila guanduensis]|uniref:Gamma-glutamyltranspeptidase / glutathione hydrolase n=1 Tax=Actinacidiphila guanduensis TaxID=310781 RepID=A0A1H0PYW6_9ACTN|nr:gamma-glutamyltransferase [Actinacidiphila guanduensis]SDP09915.1 gamma-glutamyltranspeptidase / glutathione hydrolase [Actinacidiphila guanduensis]
MFTTRPTLQGTFGMVSSTHWLASQSAMAVLEDGGNAFDAAVAAAFVLHVVEPHLNGPGGDVVMILAPTGREPVVLCGQGPAPAGATIEHYTGLGLEIVPGTGPLAAAIPGAFDAWLTLLRDQGTKSLSEVLAYAIGYAEKGHPVVDRVGMTVEAVRELFETEWTTSAELYLPHGKAPAPGSLLKNPALAATWRRVIREAEAAGSGREAQIDAARRAWREGFVAEALAAHAALPTMDTSGERHSGTMTGDDLAAWSATYEQPVTYDWNGWTVAKAGPWSQGPVFLQQLALLPTETPEYGTAEYVHTLVEGAKLALADREAWYGDAQDVPVGELLADEYNEARRALIAGTASASLRPGRPGGREPRLSEHARKAAQGALPREAAAAGVGEPTVERDGATRGDTCHLDVVDRWGNMIAATPSGGWLQSNPVVPSLGFPLGTRLQMAWLEPGLPNSLTPGRRPRTTLTPSLASRGGTPVMAFGTPGGDQQDQWSLHFFLAVAARPHVRGGLDLQGAIDAPNWHTDSFPGSFYPRGMQPRSLAVESRIGQEVIAELRRRGHEVTVKEPWSLGRLCAVARDPETGVVSAAANPREMQGYATGR